MAKSPSWEESPDVWDTVTLASIPLPGVCTLKIKPNRRIDKKQSSGKKGAAIIDKGPGLAKIDISWKFTAKDWSNVQEAIAALYPYKQTPIPLDIVHPIAQVFGIKSIYLEDIEGDDPNDVGLCEWKISGYEYAKPSKSAVKKLDKSYQGAKFGPPKPPPVVRAGENTGDALTNYINKKAADNRARGLDTPDVLPPPAAPQRRSAPSQNANAAAPPPMAIPRGAADNGAEGSSGAGTLWRSSAWAAWTWFVPSSSSRAWGSGRPTSRSSPTRP